jgi:hypothetical protein
VQKLSTVLLFSTELICTFFKRLQNQRQILHFLYTDVKKENGVKIALIANFEAKFARNGSKSKKIEKNKY